MSYNYSEIVEYLLDWYDLNARILPWREKTNPYYIWVSEIMLQQTRVEAVKPYFDRFINNLPEIKDLARVQEEDLLKLWEGLGYYNRVRNLQKAAITIMEEYNGSLPASYQELLKLKGIGPYTAGAIASIAYQIPVPAIDGNVYRVTKRIAGSFDDITKSSVQKELEKDLLAIMPKDRPGDFNQALMELGATVCIPNGKPICDKCPVMHLCRGFHNGTMCSIPVKPEKKKRKLEDKTILIMEFQDKIAIRKRESKGLLAGLWEFPSIEGRHGILDLEENISDYIINDNTVKKPDTNYKSKIEKSNVTKQEVAFNRIESLGDAKHIFSHIEWRMLGYRIKLNRLITDNSLIWVTKKEIEDRYTLPSAFEKYMKQL